MLRVGLLLTGMILLTACVGPVTFPPPEDAAHFKRADYECRRDTDQARLTMRRLYLQCMDVQGYRPTP